MELFQPVLVKILELAVLLAVAWVLRRLTERLNRRRQHVSQAWPTTSGHIEWATAKMIGEGHSGYWVGELAYSYSASGEYFAGTCLLPASSEEEAYRSVAGWKDRAVTIRYCPENPSDSVLVITEQVQPYIESATFRAQTDF